MPRIENEMQARELIGEKIQWDSVLHFVWFYGDEPTATYAFLEIDSSGTRSLWQVGPRGGLNKLWSYTEEFWEILVKARVPVA
jgi:hypothetical protein